MLKKVILVDGKNREIGWEEKIKAHKEGKLHRAFSIFVFNSKGELLLQKRAETKYHSPALWTNTCCSHPTPGKKLIDEAIRRLKEEMGIESDLREIFSFVYKAIFGNLTEYEFAHVFVGKFNGTPILNREETEDWKWIKPEELKRDIKENPQNYTYWFKLILDKVLKVTKIYRLYLSLLKKYGKPEGFWKKWCKRRKTKKDKEEIVLGAILTQRTNWKNVELVLRNLRRAKVLSIERIYQIGKKNRELLEKLIRPSGFYKQKAENISRLCEFIVENHKSLEKFLKQDLESCRRKLLKLPGVGPETADSILLYAGEFPVFVIDEYTRRFVKKHNLANKLSYDYLQQLFQQNLPNDVKVYQDFHAMIVLDGKGKGRRGGDFFLALKLSPG